MIPFILYCIFGLITSYTTAIVTHINKQPVKLDEVVVQGFFWPYTIIGTLIFLIKEGKK
jgi:hypothetical protein